MASSSSLMYPAALNSRSPSLFSFNRSLNPFPTSQKIVQQQKRISRLSIKAQTLDFSGTFFEGGFSGEDEPPIIPGSSIAIEEKEEPQCPPGLRKYETMVVLRPDMSEDERLNLTQKYEEVISIAFFKYAF